MKPLSNRSWLYLGLVVIAAGISFALLCRNAPVDSAATIPLGLVASPALLDLGQLEPNAVITRSVSWSNRGKRDITIKAISSDCGWTVGSVDRPLLRPGGKSVITIRFDATGFMGPVRRQVLVATDESPKGGLAIPVAARVRVGLRAAANQVFLGSGRGDQILRGAVEMLRDPDMDVDVMRVTGLPPDADAIVGDWSIASDICACRIEFRVPVAEHEVGLHTCQSTIWTSDGHRFPLEVRYEVLPLVSADPPTVVLSAPHGPQSKSSILLKWSSGNSVEFQRLTALNGTFIASIVAHEPSQCHVEILPTKRELGVSPEFDVLQIIYRTGGDDRQEEVNIPIILAGGTE